MAVTVPAPRTSPFDLPRSRYRVLVGDYRTKRILGELPASTIRYEELLGAPGAATVTVPVEHPAVTRDVVWPGRRVLFIECDGAVVWGGWIWTCRAGGDDLEITAEGWWSYFRHRYRYGPWTWTATDQLAIARGLLGVLEEDALAMPDIDPNPATSGVILDYTWQGHDKTAAAALEELSGLVAGFEWSFTFAWDGLWPQPVLHFHTPYRGVRRTAPVDEALPIVGVDLLVDATSVLSAVTAFGKDNPDYPDEPATGRWWTVRTAAPDHGYPELQGVIMMRDVEDEIVLRYAAEAHGQPRSDVTQIPTVTFESPPPQADADEVAPGDTIRIRVSRGWVELDAWYRVLGRTVTVDDTSERVGFTVSPRVLLSSGP